MTPRTDPPVRNLLIFRVGSIGDTVVALPALRRIEKCFPDSRRVLLTNFPTDGGKKEAPIATVLAHTGLVHEYIEYPARLNTLPLALRLIRTLRSRSFDALIYLMPVRQKQQLIRDWLFFKSAGIPRCLGLNFSKRYQTHLRRSADRYEHESERLLRNLHELGNRPGTVQESSNTLAITRQEMEAASVHLNGRFVQGNFVVANIGGKVAVKDWGEVRWNEWAQRFSTGNPGLGLVTVGSADERDRSERLCRNWRGESLNLCGTLTPRQCAVILHRAKIFVGHDSGPMHLAAAAGTPCVAIFSARAAPGTWFPMGNHHEVLYRQTPCFGCGLSVCKEHQMKCIASITVEDVIRASERALKARTLTGEKHSTCA
ncbi:MAG: glycosyltransferase family 9 protein [Nevskiales bacterium]|nr:glycosyltransferase family 9 protein [Nevskiales bacterium]